MDTERLPGGHSQHGDDAIRMGIGPHCHLCWRSQRCVQHGLGIEDDEFGSSPDELSWGPYIKDVRTEGGRGVGPKAEIVREVAWIYFYSSSQNSDKGGRWSKNPKILRKSFMYGPFRDQEMSDGGSVEL